MPRPSRPTRFPRPDRLLVVTAALALGAAACSQDPTVDTTTPGTSSTAVDETTTTAATGDGGELALTESCSLVENGVTIEIAYPTGWVTNDGQVVAACTAFDPEPFEIPPRSEFPAGLAAVVRVEPVAFETATASTTDRVEDERVLRVDDRRAVRQEVVATGDGLAPAGERSLRYLIDAGPERTIIATTRNTAGNDFDRSAEILAAMVEAFAITPAA